MFARVFASRRRDNNFSFSPKSFHLTMAFARWRTLTLRMREAVQTKERFINHWLLAYEHYRIRQLKKSFDSLRILGKHLKATEQKEMQLRYQVEDKLLNTIFYQWIDSYNSRVSYRQKLFRATQHWSTRTQFKYFFKIRAHTNYQRESKFKYRNFFLVRCITEILRRGVPKQLYQSELGSYSGLLQRLIDLRRLKHIDDNEVTRTLYLFEMQVKAAIFHQMKSDYERISTFKGTRSMKLCTSVIASWREYASHKSQVRDVQENFLQRVIVKRYSKLLQVWQAHSHKCQTLKKLFIIN